MQFEATKSLPSPPTAAIGTSEWTGVPLRQLLLAAGVKPEARFIHFRRVLPLA